MSKFFRLCSCEFTKIMKKKSTKVMLIILIVSLFASAGLAALTKKMYTFADSMYEEMDYKQMLQSEIDSNKYELSTNGDSLDEATKNDMQAQIDVNELAIENNINIYITDWKTDILMNDILDSKVKIYNFKSLRDETSELTEQEIVNKKIEILKNNDFSKYMNSKKEELKIKHDTGIIDEQEYKDELYVIELKEKYEIGKEYNSENNWKIALVDEIKLLKSNLRSGVDAMTQKALTEKTLKQTENNIKLNEYRLENNLPPFMSMSETTASMGSTRKVYDYMVGSLTMMVLAVMMIIIAGSSISSETSKGTIKFWSFTPNKRWKILLSKLIVNIFILVFTTILISLASTLIGNIFFGSGESQPYLYVSGGTVHSINYIVFSILYNLAMGIDILVFLLLAMMLSTVARSTAVAVGTSIAAYLGGATIMQMLNMFVKAEWLKFIPFNNLTLADRIFTGDVSYSASAMVSSLTGNISVPFSLAVLGVTALIMIVTMFDSFRKRDLG